MKVRLSLKFVLGIWISLTIILLGLMISAYSRLNPESFLVLLNEQVEKNYPGSKLTVRDMQYKFQIDFSLTLKDMVITKDKDIIAEVRNAEIKIPWWLLLVNRGNAQVNLSDLNIYVREGNNPAKIAKDLKLSSGKISVKVPSYMSDANYTLRAKNISIRQMGSNRRYFTISKILVREFRYGKNSAFEVNIPIRISHKDKKYISDLWLFGDVTPSLDNWSMNYRGEFKTKEASDKFEFEDLVIDGKANFRPGLMEVYSNFDLLIEKKPVGQGEFKSPGNQVDLNLQFNAFPLQFLNLVGEEIKNPFWTSMDGVAIGELSIKRKFTENSHSTLSGKLNFPGHFVVNKSGDQIADPIAGTWQLNFINGKWETSFLSPKHEVTFFRRAAVNFKQGNVTQYSQELGFSGLPLGVALDAVESLGSFLSSSDEDYHSTHVSIKEGLENNEVYTGFFKLGILPQQRFYEGELKSDKSKMSLRYQDKSSLKQVEVLFENFSVNERHQYFSPFFSAANGTVNGRIQGKWSTKWYEGNWLQNIKASNVSEAKGSLIDSIDKLTSIYNLEKATDRSFSFEATVNKSLVKLKSLLIEGSDPASIVGKISLETGKTELTLNYPKNKKWVPVVKETSEVMIEKEFP